MNENFVTQKIDINGQWVDSLSDHVYHTQKYIE